MITPGYSLTAAERVLPNMMLDFTTASLDSRVTVTRALDTATRVNSSGYIETVNANLPRFDFSPTSVGTCRGLLIEEARANLFLRSNEFATAANWVTGGATVSSDVILSPDGLVTADKLEEAATTGTHGIRQNVAVLATTYTYSVYVKAAERQWVFLLNNSVANVSAYFNVSAGTVGNVGSDTTARIENAGNGFYRCSITYTKSAGTHEFYIITATANGVGSFAGTLGSGLYLYGAQLEAGAFPTSYIPTTTTSLTRNADIVSMTGTNFSSWYNTSEGTLVFDYDIPTYLSFPVLGGIGQNTFNTTARFNVVNAIRANGTSFPTIVVCGTAVKGVGKVALGLKENDYVAYENGSLNGADTSGTMIPAASNRFNIGWDETDDNTFLNAHIRKIQYYPLRLTNAQLAAISK